MAPGPGGRPRRGVGSTAGVAMAVIVVVAIALYVYSNVLKPPATALDPLLKVLDEHLSQRLLVGLDGNGYYVMNAGSTAATIEYLVLRDASSGALVLTKAGTSSTCSITRTVVQPGEVSRVSCRERLELVAVTSSDGRVFARDPRLTAPQLLLPVQPAVPHKVLLTPEVVSRVERYAEDIDRVRVRTQVALTRLSSCCASEASVMISANASLVVVLRSPSTPDAWNVLIVGYGAYGRRSNSRLMVGNVCNLNLSSVGALRFRIKIENLSIGWSGALRIDGVQVTSPGVFPCMINRGRQCWVEVSGVAGRILAYAAGPSAGSGEVEPHPYYITGDLDDNGYPELIFVTEDFTVGDSSRRNDEVRTSTGVTVTAVDELTRPLRLVLSGTPINNSRHAVAVVSARFFFWDNSLDDISDNDNRVIIRVGLYDPARSEYVYSVSLSYFELCRYRTVTPLTVSYVVKDFLLYVPSPAEIGERTLFIAVDILDPYHLEGTRNDADIIFAIEYLGLVLGARRGGGR